MTLRAMRGRAATGALMVCCLMLPMLSGCSLWNRVVHHRPKDAGCVERPFSQNTGTRPPLKVPEGLSSPDTRNAIKVPDLTGPERPRARTEPCLSRPPSYFAKPLDTNLPAPPPKPKRWWQFWRKAPPPVPATVSQPAPTSEPAPAPATPAPAPAPGAPATAK